MRLTLLNGSPRGMKSNTRLVLERLAEGAQARGTHQIDAFYLTRRRSWEACRRAMASSDVVIFAMPLYVHAMPALVKEFIETLQPFAAGARVRMGFIVQSGFPEPAQSFLLRRYLERLPARLNAEHAGTAIRGAVEGIQVVPDWVKRKFFAQLRALGTQLVETGAFDPETVREMAGPDHLTFSGRLSFRLLNGIGVGPNGYFGRQLKANGALDRSFDRPYAPTSTAEETAGSAAGRQAPARAG